jgi:transposase
LRHDRSVQLNGQDSHAYLKDILTRLPTHRASDIAALSPASLAA